MTKLSNDDYVSQAGPKPRTGEQPSSEKSPLLSSIVVPWKDTKIGDEWATYNEIVQIDPLLEEKLKPIDGFKIVIEGYRYSVKVNSAGITVVFRNKKYHNPFTSFDGNTINKANHTPNENQGSELDNTDNPSFSPSYDDNRPTLHRICRYAHNNKQFVDIKLVEASKFFLEEGWEIHPFMPICIIGLKPHVILVLCDTQAAG